MQHFWRQLFDITKYLSIQALCEQKLKLFKPTAYKSSVATRKFTSWRFEKLIMDSLQINTIRYKNLSLSIFVQITKYDF